MKRVILLGASGSIGQQTLSVLKDYSTEFKLVAISVGNNILSLTKALDEFPSIEAYYSINDYNSKVQHFSGSTGIIELLDSMEYDICINALVGSVGFLPSVKVLQSKKKLCLANKESLAIGGFILNDLVKRGFGELIAIDSEHSAIYKCLNGRSINDIEKIILTSSGGSLRSYKRADLVSVTPELALNHPTWNMGKKITIDSATMMNKAFEIIEAFYLFDLKPKNIEVILHKESHVHALIELKDHSFLASISVPNMREAILYSLLKETVYEMKNYQTLDVLKTLHFKKLSKRRYPLVELGYFVIKKNPLLGIVLNTANDICVQTFLECKLPFLMIEEVLSETINFFYQRLKENPLSLTLESIVLLEIETRSYLRHSWQLGGE